MGWSEVEAMTICSSFRLQPHRNGFGGHDHVGHIMVRAKSPLLVDQALKEVKTIIMRNHGGDDTFFRTWSAKKGIANAKKNDPYCRDGSRRYCVCGVDCCVYRYSQYHARLGDGTDPRNWITESRRREKF